MAVIHDFFKDIAENLAAGFGFNSEYIRIQPTISGVFKGISDQFDQERHQKEISIVATAVLKDALTKLQLEKVEANSRKPKITSVLDLKSQQTDCALTPGHMIELRGNYLKLNLQQEDEGIFLVNTSDTSEFKLQQVHDNFPSKLSGMLPDDLLVGENRIEVRCRLKGNATLFTGVFSEVLYVN